MNYSQIFVSSLQNISLAIAALLDYFYYYYIINILLYKFFNNNISIAALYILINKYNSIKLAKISRIIAKIKEQFSLKQEPLGMDEEIL